MRVHHILPIQREIERDIEKDGETDRQASRERECAREIERKKAIDASRQKKRFCDIPRFMEELRKVKKKLFFVFLFCSLFARRLLRQSNLPCTNFVNIKN